MTQTDLFTGGIPHTQTEAEKRDTALERLEKTRAELIAEGRRVADELAYANGSVTSVEVFAKMRDNGWGPDLDDVDPRWAGCLFRKGWRRVGYEPAGSHGRPVARWEKR